MNEHLVPGNRMFAEVTSKLFNGERLKSSSADSVNRSVSAV